MPGPAPSSPQHADGQVACADARHGRRRSSCSMWPTVAALAPQARNATSHRTLSGTGRCSRISAHARAKAGCDAFRQCRFRRPDLGAGEENGDTDVPPWRCQIRSHRRRPWSGAVSDSVVDAADAPPPSSKTVPPRRGPRTAKARSSLSGASLVAVPGPAPSSPQHGDGQFTCADARHERPPSSSSTGPTVTALAPQVRIAASRPTPCGTERWSRISARSKGKARCFACRRSRFRRPDLGSGEEDGHADHRQL